MHSHKRNQKLYFCSRQLKKEPKVEAAKSRDYQHFMRTPRALERETDCFAVYTAVESSFGLIV